jgi:hypothetical protein
MSVPSHVTPLMQIDNSRSDWSIKVRVVRIWYVRSIIDQNKTNEIQLILVDQEVIIKIYTFTVICHFYEHNFHVFCELKFVLISKQGSKIQATVPAHSVDRLCSIFYEGGVYLMSNFQVKRNVGKCMIAMNQFKLIFFTTTMVIPSQSLVIPHYSLLLFSSQTIRSYEKGLSHLIGMDYFFVEVTWCSFFYFVIDF